MVAAAFDDERVAVAVTRLGNGGDGVVDRHIPRQASALGVRRRGSRKALRH